MLSASESLVTRVLPAALECGALPPLLGYRDEEKNQSGDKAPHSKGPRNFHRSSGGRL
jgi:hypothetical protein